MTVSIGDFPAGTPNRLSLRIGCYILFALATTSLSIRIYARTFLARTLGLDDLFVVFAWCSEVAHIAGVKLQFENGVGWHVADLATLPDGPAVMSRMILWPWVTQFLYFFGLGCVKASIVALYLRLAVTSLQRKILWGMLAFILAQGFSSTIVVAAFLCSPLSQVWTNPTAIGGPTCINILSFNYYNAALFIAIDLFLALSPIVVIKNLHMNHKKKRGLGIMFSLGILVIGGTIARQVTNAIAITHTEDFTWHWAPAALCSVLESSLGIIFVCVPAMAPLFKNLVGGSSAGQYDHTPGNYRSDRPSTFGKLRNKPDFRPDDESLMCTTQIAAADGKDPDAAVETYEMDQQTGDYSGDAGSERRIITPPLEVGQGRPRAQKGRGLNGNGRDRKNGGVTVKKEYEVSHSYRSTGGK